MSTKKWLILLSAVAVLCLAGAGVLGVCVGFGLHAVTLPVYKIDQTPSAHAGYLRTTITSGQEVYVSDYEEAALRLANVEPPQPIGSMGMPGNTGVRVIPGQPVTAYIAGDEGSEMPAYTPFRRVDHPAFNWRTASFREMMCTVPVQGSPVLKTTDPALMSEVVRLLRDGTPVNLSAFPMSGAPNVSTLNLTSDELPGLFFCPSIRTDASGTFYVAESLMLVPNATPPQFQARWIPASPTLTRWLRSRQAAGLGR